uniref:Kinesin motor domain-containing protein n=1 Tax=Ascaris lumbricoides TaxID=6252 RepID=A0A0M3I959_ASCLU
MKRLVASIGDGQERAHKDKLLSTSAHFPALLNTSFENYATVQIGSFKTSMAVLSIVDLASRDPLN